MQRSGVYRAQTRPGKQSKGLHLHSTFAVTSSGLPLGVLRAECTARGSEVSEDDRPLSAILIEEKNTFSWIQGVRLHGYQTADAPHRFGQCNGSGGRIF